MSMIIIKKPGHAAAAMTTGIITEGGHAAAIIAMEANILVCARDQRNRLMDFGAVFIYWKISDVPTVHPRWRKKLQGFRG